MYLFHCTIFNLKSFSFLRMTRAVNSQGSYSDQPRESMGESRASRPRASVWGTVPIAVSKPRSRVKNLSPSGVYLDEASDLPPQYPTRSSLERLGECLRHVCASPTEEIKLIPPIVSSPRAAHLLPRIPGRIAEESQKDKSIHFSYQLFKRVKKVDRNRFFRCNKPHEDVMIDNSMAFLFRDVSVHDTRQISDLGYVSLIVCKLNIL